MTQLDSDVLIVGAGPTGLTLAIDLGRRGVRCTLIEQKERPAFLPKMERINARSMEIYRRMGLADKIRAAGLRSDCPMDVYIILKLTEPPLLHLSYPSVDEARANTRASNDGTLPLEPYQLVSQYTLEPFLKSVAETLPTVTVRFGCEFLSLRQDGAGVTARVQTGGATQDIRAAYLVGCDGGASPVRRELGISLSGEGNLLGLRQALFRCDELFDRLPIGNGPGHGRHYHVADAKSTFLIMQDSTKHWTLHSVVDTDEEMKAAFERVVGVPVKYEMLSCAPWRQNLLLADRYGKDRVFLAGDAVHLVIPTGGLGMNSGVGDAVDLSWKLAATLAGWGGPELLKSYEIERRQIGDRNVGASRYATIGRRKWRSLWRPDITEDSPAGAATRKNLGAVADVEQRKSNEMIGAELGYRYVDSPVICQYSGRSGASVPRVSSDHLARRAAAACLARRRHADAGPRRRRLRDPQTRQHRGRCERARKRTSFAWRAGRGAGHPGPHRARHLRLRSDFGAARPARRVARQRSAGGSGRVSRPSRRGILRTLPRRRRSPGVGSVFLLSW